jgi:hypothetical protein
MISKLNSFQQLNTSHLSELMLTISVLLSEPKSIQLKVDMSKPPGIMTSGFPP